MMIGLSFIRVLQNSLCLSNITEECGRSNVCFDTKVPSSLKPVILAVFYLSFYMLN